MSDYSNTASSKPAPGSSGTTGWVPLVMLCVITLLATANAWHDTLVFDDKAFVGPDVQHPVEQLSDAFSRNLWGHEQAGAGLYRPLLLVGFEIQDRVFGDWARGYHAVNVLLHLAVTLSLYGFLGMLARRSGLDGKTAGLVALLAALVFAVHPVHAEVVNSVFNGSSLIVALATVIALWWLLQNLQQNTLRAWLGFGIVYTVAIYFKESALVMPGLAVALIVILGPGTPVERIRRFLPVFWMLIPIAVYFYFRAMALATGTAESMVNEAMPSQFSQMISATDLPDPGRLLSVLGVLGAGIELFAWPYPLKLIYGVPVGGELMFVIAIQVVLAVLALVLMARGRPALAAGLAIYYIAMLPASRILSMDGSGPHLSDRYLYVPSIGLVLATAALLSLALRGRWKKPVLATVFPVIVVLAALNWERNSAWQSQAVLFETDYANGNKSGFMVRMLINEHANEDRTGRVIELCDNHPETLAANGALAFRCGVTWVNNRRRDDGIAALELAERSRNFWLEAGMLLADIRVLERQPMRAAEHFSRLIDRFERPEQKEVYRGISLVRIWPEDRQKLLEARNHFERALEISPGLEAAITWREHVDGLLEEMAAGDADSSPDPQTDP